MQTLRIVALVGALQAFAVPALAQVPGSPLSFAAFAGTSVPHGDLADVINPGYVVGGAIDLRPPLMPLGFRAEGSLASHGVKGAGPGYTLSATDLGANLNVVLWFPTPPLSPIAPYVTGGTNYSRLGKSYREGTATLIMTEDRYGFNGGAGIDIGVGGVALRIDARYKRIYTDENYPFATIPITVGIRF